MIMNYDYTRYMPPYGPPQPPQKKSRHVFRWVAFSVFGLIVFAVVIALIAGGGTTSTPGAQTATSSAPASQTPTTPPPTTPTPADSQPTASDPAASTSGPLGTTFTVSSTDYNGNSVTYDVTATKVDQHSSLTPYDSLSDPADHLAAVRFTITGDTGQASDDANNLASAIGADTSEYSAALNDTPDGGNFNSGDFAVSPGETVSGWVTFELPPGQTITSIQWTPGYDGNHASWTVK